MYFPALKSKDTYERAVDKKESKQTCFEVCGSSIFDKITEFAQYIVNHVWFDRVMLAVILFNSALMASADYTHVDNSGRLSPDGSFINQLITTMETVFTIIYTAEFVVKVVAMGVDISNPNSYFRDTM